LSFHIILPPSASAWLPGVIFKLRFVAYPEPSMNFLALTLLGPMGLLGRKAGSTGRPDHSILQNPVTP
jgi:hypothetical protein